MVSVTILAATLALVYMAIRWRVSKGRSCEVHGSRLPARVELVPRVDHQLSAYLVHERFSTCKTVPNDFPPFLVERCEVHGSRFIGALFCGMNWFSTCPPFRVEWREVYRVPVVFQLVSRVNCLPSELV